jgi:hypothetical protein
VGDFDSAAENQARWPIRHLNKTLDKGGIDREEASGRLCLRNYLGYKQMSDDCTHGHNSQSEETYFYKETARLVADLRRMSDAMRQAAEKTPIADVVIAAARTRAAA